MQYSLSIPVNKYQMAILQNALGANPWTIDTKSWYSKILINHMGKSRHIPHPSQPSPHNFVVILPHWFVKHYGLNSISPENITAFINCAEREFRRGLFIHLEHTLIMRDKLGQGQIRKLSLTIKDSMLEYCTSFGLQEAEIPFEALSKAFYRSRKNSESSLVLSSEYYSRKLSDAQR